MVDVGNRRREPKGIPTGGRFADENGGGSDASDLEAEDTAAVIEDLPDGSTRVSHPDDPTITFVPRARQGGFDRAYAAAVSSPYRLGGAVRVGCDGSNITVHYESDPVFIDACVDPSDPDGTMLSVMRLVDACHAIAATSRSVRRVDATEGTLAITMADRSQVLVQPSMCEATRFDAHGDLIQSATLNPHPAGASKRPGDDFALDTFAQGLPGSFYDAVDAANALAGGHRRDRRDRPAHAKPTARPKGFAASGDGNAVGSAAARVRVRRARMSTATDDDLNAVAQSAVRLGLPTDVAGSQVTARSTDGHFVRADKGAGYAAVWRVDRNGDVFALSEFDMSESDEYLNALPPDRRERFRTLVSDAYRLTF